MLAFLAALYFTITWPVGTAALDVVSHSGSQLHLKGLPFCEEHIHKVHGPARESMRDLIQDWMLQKRVETEMNNLLPRLLDPPSDEEERRTWTTHLTADEIRSRRDNATSKRTAVEAHIAAAFKAMRKAGLVSDHTTLLDLTHCLSGRVNPHAFVDQPVVSFLLQYFKRPHMIDPLVGMAQACNKLMPVELLVNVDNPSEGQRWADLSWSTKGLVVPVFSNNVHEARAYNRLAGLARGKYLVILQDDELVHPLDCSWIKKLVAQFESMPSLGMVGMDTYTLGYGDGNFEGYHLMDPVTKNPITFAFQVDFAPTAIRKAVYKYIGGMDESLSEPGECGIMGDWEMALRMWVAGWSVAHMPLIEKKADELDKFGGTHRPETYGRCWGRQFGLAADIYWARYGKGYYMGVGCFMELLEEHVRVLSLLTLQRLDPAAQCPFRRGCDPANGSPSLTEKDKCSEGTEPYIKI